jgi:hypothetical protein
MRYAYVRLLAASAALLGGHFSVHAAPVANLPLTCLNPNAVGLHQNSCSGLRYQLPNSDQLTVLGATYIWSMAANVANPDRIAVCTLPVEPGTASSCRDALGVRRTAFVAKSQIFASPPSGAQVLDLTRTPVEITQPGVYVLNRSWPRVFNGFPEGVIRITADDVTFDMQGFELTVDGIGITSTGHNDIIRNGSVRGETGPRIQVFGSGTRIENMRVRTDAGGGIILGGAGSVLSDSVVIGNEATAVHAGNGAIVRDNFIFSQRTALSMSSNGTAVGNDFSNCAIGPCITVEGEHNVVERNRITMIFNANKYGLIVVGNQNLVLGNIFRRCVGTTAILLGGRANIVRDNLVPRSEPWEFGGEPTVCGTGIDFQQDGNFYGDNTMWATAPFNVGATVQTDLGGNVGIVH